VEEEAMIVTKTPLRISFLGGGSDIPAFYLQGEPGRTVSVTIDKFIHVVVAESFSGFCRVMTDGFYSGENWKEVQDKRVQACLEVMSMHTHRLEIASFCDIPSYGTGMGSSSAFTVGLLNALFKMQGKKPAADQVAELACHVEIDVVMDPIGKQDQYAAAITGLNYYTFTKARVAHKSIQVPGLEESCRLYYLDRTRKASTILEKQDELLRSDKKTWEDVQFMSLKAGAFADDYRKDVETLAKSMRESWEIKKKLVEGITDKMIEKVCETGMGAGALACKVLGAGGGGYVLFLCPPQKGLILDKAMTQDCQYILKKYDFKFWSK
jgi:D-glycero-alpha-D-manno-heptose-7-phosphate kinase